MGNLKTGESNSEDVIIQDKEEGEGEIKRNDEGEDGYGTRPGLTRL